MDQLTRIEKAQRLMSLGRYEGAIETLKECLGENSYLEEVYIRLGVCYMDLDRIEAAEGSLQLAITENPNNPEIHYFYSFLYRKKEKLSLAFKHINEALKMAPTKVKYLTQIAVLYIDQYKYVKAEEYLRIAEQEEPEDLDVIMHLANILMAKSKNEESFHYIQRGLQIDPNDVTLLSLQSRLLAQKTSTIKEAEENAINALRLDPNDAYAKASLLETLKNKNGLFRFFIGNSFNRYTVEWTAGRVILAILCWKGFLFLGFFVFLYLLITWYCGVLFNTFLRLHKRYKYLLDPAEIKQSNVFIGMNVGLVITILGLSLASFNPVVIIGVLLTGMVGLLVALSFFEISRKKGRTQFYVFMGIAAILVLPFIFSSPLVAGFASLFLLLVYAFCFTLTLAFH